MRVTRFTEIYNLIAKFGPKGIIIDIVQPPAKPPSAKPAQNHHPQNFVIYTAKLGPKSPQNGPKKPK